MSNQKLNKVEVDKPLIHPVEYKLDHPVLLAAEALLANQLEVNRLSHEKNFKWRKKEGLCLKRK